jgi:hypothetical protein
MLHLCKLSVGVRDIAALRAIQATRTPLCHRTRNHPRRHAEILQGGSIYWVIAGVLQVRQRILDITEDCWEDGSACAALVLDPELVAVASRAIRPFQGWRYLEPQAAPPDLVTMPNAQGEAELPETMRRDLRALCLL